MTVAPPPYVRLSAGCSMILNRPTNQPTTDGQRAHRKVTLAIIIICFVLLHCFDDCNTRYWLFINEKQALLQNKLILIKILEIK